MVEGIKGFQGQRHKMNRNYMDRRKGEGTLCRMKSYKGKKARMRKDHGNLFYEVHSCRDRKKKNKLFTSIRVIYLNLSLQNI